jgi:hypothetical protein
LFSRFLRIATVIWTPRRAFWLYSSSKQFFIFGKRNFHNINSIKSFLIFPAGSLFSRFLRIATVIRTPRRAF